VFGEPRGALGSNVQHAGTSKKYKTLMSLGTQVELMRKEGAFGNNTQHH
jgi:hypothetical protein